MESPPSNTDAIVCARAWSVESVCAGWNFIQRMALLFTVYLAGADAVAGPSCLVFSLFTISTLVHGACVMSWCVRHVRTEGSFRHGACVKCPPCLWTPSRCMAQRCMAQRCMAQRCMAQRWPFTLFTVHLARVTGDEWALGPY